MRLHFQFAATLSGLALAGTFVGGALSFFTVSAAGGSAGGAAAGSVNGVTGLALGSGAVTPTASRNLPLTWNATTLANGGAVTGYVVRRYDSGGSQQSVGASCGGTLTTTSCTESGVPDGTWTYGVRATFDNWLGAESARITVRVDTSAPTITSRPASVSASSTPSFAFTHSTFAGFKCKVDGGVFASCTSPYVAGPLADGSHTFTVEAVDAANVATQTTSYTWSVVTVAPTITAKPAATSANGSPSFSFSDASYAILECSLDGGGFSSCTSPRSFSTLADGSHTFRVRAKDADGVATAAASYTWTISTSAPTLTGQPASPTNQTAATFTFSDGTYSRYTCKLDSGGAAACNSGAVTYSGPLADGSHTFTVYAVDADGAQTQSRTYTWTIDTTVPALQTLQMFDNDHNGKVDHVVATFNETLGSCTAPCTSGWTLSNVPSEGTLSSVTISGTTATLNLTEGAGAANTAVGSFTVALAASGGIVDAAGNHSSFAAQAPADKAAPVPVAIVLTNGNGTIGAGDTASVTFSEPLAVASVCSTWSGDSSNQTLTGNGNVVVTVSDNGAANDTLSSVAATSGCGGVVHFGVVNLGSTGWLATTNTFSGNGGNRSQVDWTVATSTLMVTLGKASGTVGSVAGSVSATYTPDAAITDQAGNTAAGSVTATTKF